jgi:uncharacterized protein (TIGR00251 family)
MANLEFREAADGVIFTAKVVPGSSKTVICGLLDGMLKVKVLPPPEKGKANQALCQFLAKQLGVKRNAVSIVSGHSQPIKTIRVSGISARTLSERLER